LLLGPSHRTFAPLAILSSGAFLVACDAVARCLIPPADLPVGIVTALLGGPFFLWILLRTGKSGNGLM
jgi:iron complex transport system permease protein